MKDRAGLAINDGLQEIGIRDVAGDSRDATVSNRGTRAVEEVVQLYTHQRTASVTRPVRELKAFRKIALAPGQSEVVRFTLRPADLSFYGRDGRLKVEPGTFDVWIAPSAEAEGVSGSFELTA